MVNMAPLSYHILLFEFNMEEDFQWLLGNGPWWFGKSDLHFKRWYFGFTQKKESFNIVPI